MKEYFKNVDVAYIGEIVRMVGFWLTAIVLTVAVIIFSIIALREMYGDVKDVWAKEDRKRAKEAAKKEAHNSNSNNTIFSEYGRRKALPTWENRRTGTKGDRK